MHPGCDKAGAGELAEKYLPLIAGMCFARGISYATCVLTTFSAHCTLHASLLLLTASMGAA